MKNDKFISLEQSEMTDIYGGIEPVTVALLGIAVTYFTWAADFCYTLGKD